VTELGTRELAGRAVRTAFRVYRRHPATVAAVAAIVFAPVALLDTVASTQAEALFDDGGGRAIAGVLVLLATSVLTAGAAVGAGLLDRLVAREFGVPAMSMRAALRSLPKARLVGLDLSVSVVVAVGTVLGVLPGLAAYTLLCLSGPLLVRDDLGVRGAMSRSFELTRHHLLATVLVVTVPVVLEHELLDALEILWDFPFVVLFAAHMVMAVVVLASVVVVEIALAQTLANEAEREGKETVDGQAQPVPL
jgi:hypothetical protein